MSKDKSTITLSEEKRFIFHESHNRGHVTVPAMVQSCIGLSSGAKNVYSFLSRYVQERGHKSFPNEHQIALHCDCSKRSVVTYLDELEEKRFIERRRRGKCQTNDYYLADCNHVTLLIVSEYLHEIANDLSKKYSWDKILKAKEKLLKYCNSIGYSLHTIELSSQTKDELHLVLLSIIKGGKNMRMKNSGLPRNLFYSATINHDAAVKEEPVSVEPVKQEKKQNPHHKTIKQTSRPTSNLTKKAHANAGLEENERHWQVMDIDDWTAEQFREYYRDTYLDKTGQAHPFSGKKQNAQLSRLLNNLNRDKQLLKKYIDNMFEMGYDNMSLDVFVTTSRLAEIQTYMNTGKKPFYMEKANKVFNPYSSDYRTEEDDTPKRMLTDEDLDRMFGDD